MRRYELMLVLRPDTPDDEVQAVIDRATRSVLGNDGQIIKVSPWGRRRLAYSISGYREGSYFLIVFEAPASAVAELERGLNITEEVMRHLVTRVERPVSRDRRARAEEEGEEEGSDRPPSEDEEVPDSEYIDESESEAAPMAADR